jgi:hypothetical protein
MTILALSDCARNAPALVAAVGKTGSHVLCLLLVPARVEELSRPSFAAVQGKPATLGEGEAMMTS